MQKKSGGMQGKVGVDTENYANRKENNESNSLTAVAGAVF